MNPSTAFARVLVDELVRGGVTDAVVAPGSRSAPVALALADAERDGRLTLHVRIDERTAAFLALGLAKASGRPVPVLTTSGTATAHLHAAVLEADAAGVALAAALPELPFACGLATVALLDGDVTSDPLLPVDGALPVRAVSPDRLAAVAADPDTEARWRARLDAVRG